MENHNGVTTRCSGNRTCGGQGWQYSQDKKIAPPPSPAPKPQVNSRTRRISGRRSDRSGKTAVRVIGHNGRMRKPSKHSGSRRGPKTRSLPPPSVFGLALAMTAAVIAWGYLVFLAIDFGSSARSGQTQAWWFLAMASIGAVLCLFLGLVLVARILRALGLSAPSAPPSPVGRTQETESTGAADTTGASPERNDDHGPHAPGRRRLTP